MRIILNQDQEEKIHASKGHLATIDEYKMRSGPYEVPNPTTA